MCWRVCLSSFLDVLINKRRIVAFPLVSSFCVVGCPVADILASDIAMSFTVLAQHGEESVALFGGFAVHEFANDRVVRDQVFCAGIRRRRHVSIDQDCLRREEALERGW